MSPSTPELLLHILDETSYLLSIREGLSREEFLEDPTLKRAVVRSLEIIGEAAKCLSLSFTADHPECEWRLMAGMRDRLIHHYFGVDYEIVWDVPQRKIPDLDCRLRGLPDVQA